MLGRRIYALDGRTENLKLEAERSLAKAEVANEIQSDGPTLARAEPFNCAS